MKILFYDGYMPGHNDYNNLNPDADKAKAAFQIATNAGFFEKGYRYISAADGPSNVTKWIDNMYKRMPKCTLFTNSIIALSNTYAWNDITNSCDIWFWKPSMNMWVNIQDTTDKEIRKPHNIMKMYLSGAFDLW